MYTLAGKTRHRAGIRDDLFESGATGSVMAKGKAAAKPYRAALPDCPIGRRIWWRSLQSTNFMPTKYKPSSPNGTGRVQHTSASVGV